MTKTLFACDECLDRGCPKCNPSRNAIGKFARTAPKTSRDAAIAVYPRTGTQRRRILDALVATPQTAEELSFSLGLAGNSIRPRLIELREMGWIAATDKTRPTVSGQEAIVWGPTSKAVG